MNAKAIPFRMIKPPEKRGRGMMGFPSEAQADPQKAWLDAIISESADRERTLYVHIPFCKTRCPFCPFYLGSGSREEIKGYVKLLVKELETSSEQGLRDMLVNAVYFGGGTPSELEPEDFEELLSTIKRSYRLSNDCEITVEGRVSSFAEDKMKACVDNGVNRFSIGVQTFNTELRRSIGRQNSGAEVIGTLEKLASFKQAAVIIDLLYGLPGQTLAQWSEDLRTVVEDVQISGVDHYQLNIHKGLPINALLEGERLAPCPDAKTRFEMFKLGEDAMADAGATRLSVKHFAFDWRERNANNDIAVRKRPCLPFGLHSGGRLGNYMFRQTDDLKAYRRMVEDCRKPFEYAGKVPADYEVCSEIAGQISKRRSINIQKAAALDPERARAIIAICAPILLCWLNEGFLKHGQFGWMPLASEALFKHRSFAEELMDAVAEVYEETAR